MFRDAPVTLSRLITAHFIYNYKLQNPNKTQYAIEFNLTQTYPQKYTYQVWFNGSQTQNNTFIFGDQLLALQRGVDEALIAVAASTGNATTPPAQLRSINLDITLKDWPKIPALVAGQGFVQSLGPMFYFCTICVIFIVVVNQLISERSQKLRSSMNMMGLKTEIYYASTFIMSTLICALIGPRDGNSRVHFPI